MQTIFKYVELDITITENINIDFSAISGEGVDDGVNFVLFII